MWWKQVRTGHEIEDEPQAAGCEVLVTVENTFGQISVRTAFTGYGDFKWYTNDRTCMEDARQGNNRLHHAFKVLAWMPKPEAYNPYMLDGRYLLDEVRGRVRTKRSTMEICKDVIPAIESHMQEIDTWRRKDDRPD